MRRLFTVSDTHGYYTAVKKALDKQGFDINNKDHYLLLCGDLFDRGEEPTQLLEFVKSLGDRFIFVRGNHEDLLVGCLNEIKHGWSISDHHKSNGTYNTIQRLMLDYYQKQGINFFEKLKEAYEFMWGKQRKLLQQHIIETDTSKIVELYKPMDDIVEWINSKTIDYYETDKYIFVHGWIPTTASKERPYYSRNVYYSYKKDWRDSNKFEWESARWDNGMQCWKQGVVEKDKAIVCGHWHCSWGWSYLRHERKEFPQKNRRDWEASFEPFEDKGIIAIDGCIAYSGKVNILVIDEDN